MATKTITTLTVRECAGVPRVNEPIVWGIPLRKGMIADASELALLDSTGTALNAAAEATARWADGSVKWALFTIPKFAISARKSARLRVVMGRSAKVENPVRVSQTGDGVTLDNGRVRFTLRRTGELSGGIECLANDAWVDRAGPIRLALSLERAGKIEHASAAGVAREVSIESQSPLRVVALVRGRHAFGDGSLIGAFTLRVELIAGQPMVRLTHSVMFDFDTERDFLRSCEVILPARVGGDRRYSFGGDEGAAYEFMRQQTEWTPDFSVAELFQDSPTHWRIERWVDTTRRGVFGAEGLQSDGWARLEGGEGSAAVVVRELARNHPQSLTVDAAAGEIRAGLYPARAERLNLRRYSDRAYVHCYEAPCTWKTEAIPFDFTHSAHGLRKTHTLALLFDSENPAAAALAQSHGLRLEFTPAYLASTGVMQPAPAALPARWRKRIDQFIDMLGDASKRQGATGFVDFFDIPYGFVHGTERMSHDAGGLGYINDEALPGLGLWNAYLLTGRQDAFALARAMTRHHADFDCMHAGPFAGLGSRHNVNHWGDMCKEPRIAQPIGKRLAYHLTGDRSAMDLIPLTLAYFEKRFSKRVRAGLTAETPALISTLLAAQESGVADHDHWLRAIADALADGRGVLPETIDIDGTTQSAWPASAGTRPISLMMFSCFGGVQSMAELAHRFDHDALRDRLVSLAQHLLLPRDKRSEIEGSPAMHGREARARFLDLFAYAYQRTGKDVFAGQIRRHLNEMFVTERTHEFQRYGGLTSVKLGCVRNTPRPEAGAEGVALWKRYYPHIEPHTMSETFWLAVYLHKAAAMGAAGQK